MAKLKYKLNPNEQIVFKVERVRQGFWGAYTNTLVVTNQCVIIEKYGMMNNFKGIERFPMNEIRQAIIGKALNGQKQLELYFDERTEDFAPQSANEDVLRTLSMAINDQMSENPDGYDFDYYQSIMDGSAAAAKEIDRDIQASAVASNIDIQSGLSFVGDVAKNVLKSGDLSLNGIQKGVNKATRKQAKKGILGGLMDEFLDDIGVYDIQDCFTEIGNDFREELGLGHKLTHEEMREMREQEERQQAEIARKKRAAYNREVERAQQSVEAKKEAHSHVQENVGQGAKLSITEQLDALKKLKELLDAGILTREEFDTKKKEIMNS